jgi:hypothetical protein
MLRDRVRAGLARISGFYSTVMPEPTESPDKRRRLLMIAIAVLVGAVILLLVVERASIVERDAPPAAGE